MKFIRKLSNLFLVFQYLRSVSCYLFLREFFQKGGFQALDESWNDIWAIFYKYPKMLYWSHRYVHKKGP